MNISSASLLALLFIHIRPVVSTVCERQTGAKCYQACNLAGNTWSVGAGNICTVSGLCMREEYTLGVLYQNISHRWSNSSMFCPGMDHFSSKEVDTIYAVVGEI
jgi:hypothetical protein